MKSAAKIRAATIAQRIAPREQCSARAEPECAHRFRPSGNFQPHLIERAKRSSLEFVNVVFVMNAQHIGIFDHFGANEIFCAAKPSSRSES